MRSNFYCTFYIIRHGETDWNSQGLLQGHSDIPLNSKGINQAKEMAVELKKIKFAVAFSSDLLRAKKTAEIIALEKKIILKTTKALRERHFGLFEGKKWQEDKQYQSLLKKYLNLSRKERLKTPIAEGVETDEEIINRVIPFLRELAVAYQGKKILIVTHGSLMRVLLNHLGLEVQPSSIQNTAYFVLKSDGVEFKIVKTKGIIF